MSVKTKPKSSGKPLVTADSTPLPINMTFQDHRSGGATSLAWVTAVSTAIAAAGTFWGAVKPPVKAPEPDPVVDQIRKDQGLKTIDVASVVREFSSSEKLRKEFAYSFHESVGHPVATEATEAEKAISAMLDPDVSPGLRIAAALYLGGQGKREYISPLKVVSSENSVLGSAAKVAIAMLQEHLAQPAAFSAQHAFAVSQAQPSGIQREAPQTLAPPVSPKK